MGRIFFYRTALVGSAVQPGVRINGEFVGKAVPGGFFYVDSPAGNYEIAATTELKKNLMMLLAGGDIRFVRLEMKMGFLAAHVKPVLVDTDIGRQEIQKTRHSGCGQLASK